MSPKGVLATAALACLLVAIRWTTAVEVVQSTELDSTGVRARSLLQDRDDRPPPLKCGDRALYSYVVSLMSEQGSHLCGGALIKKDWVLTAARCVDVSFSQMAELRPRVNIAGRTRGTAVQTLQTVATFVPPQWNGNPRSGYDLALLKLEKAACMKPISIAGPDFNMTTDAALLYLGWGRFGNAGAFSDVLQAADMAWVPREDCKERLVENKVTKQMLCVQGVTTQGLCTGDEGSPLVYYPKDPEVLKSARDPFKLVGIGSFADVKCTEPNSISLFSSVLKLSKWIKRTIKDHEDQSKNTQ